MDVAGSNGRKGRQWDLIVSNVYLDVEGDRRVTRSCSGSAQGARPKSGLSVGPEPETGKSTPIQESRTTSPFVAINPTNEFHETGGVVGSVPRLETEGTL